MTLQQGGKARDRGWLDEPAFSAAQCERLFAAVLADDVVDSAVTLPAAIHLDYDQEQLVNSFRITRQLWMEGAKRTDLIRLMTQLRQTHRLAPADQLLFKHIRAKYKQLRFAFANFDSRHRYPRRFHFLTSVMGHLQDDFKNGRGGVVGYRASLVRLLLSPLPYALIRREIDGFQPTTPAAFRRYVIVQIDFVRSSIMRDQVSGKAFHEIRKIISRQSSFFVSLDTLYPSDYHRGVFRYLSAINGLMGRMHDELIERRISGAQDYEADIFRFPDDIKQRLLAITALYPIN